MTPNSKPGGEMDGILARATSEIADAGLHAFSFRAFAEKIRADGIVLEDYFADESSLLRAAVVRVFRGVAERTIEAVARAADGVDALNGFLRAYVLHFRDRMDEFQLAFAARQLVGCERFAIDETVQREQLLPAINGPLSAVEAKLLADRGGRELPGGIHPRRLAFVAQTTAIGLLATKALSARMKSPLKHGDEALLQEIGRALAGPITSLRQLSHLNEAAVELARLRDEPSLRRAVPELMHRALDLQDAMFVLREEGVLDPGLHVQARRAFEERSTRCAALHGEEGGGVMLAAPIRYEGEVEGVIAGRRSGALETDERDLARLDAFATIVGLTLENVRLYEGLQRQLEVRTKRLSEAQLRLAQAEKMGALGKLVAGVVHELNTPLGAAQSSQATLLRAVERLRSKVGPEAAPLIGVVTQCAENLGIAVHRISEIVAQHKRFSRLDAADREPLDIVAALRDAIAMLRHEAAPGCMMELEAEGIPRVTCMASRMNQVFLNVIRNAVQAVGDRGTVRVIARHGIARHVSIVVEDNGRGIPAEDVPRVFEPGFTAKGGRVRAGLGLAISYQIVVDHGGEIRIESEIGKGTRVTIALPIDTGHDAA